MPIKSRLAPIGLLLKTTGRLFSPHPLRSEDTVYKTPPFFIVSSGRSGTTLLRAMLIQNPTVHIPPEFKLIRNLYLQFQRIHRYLPWHYTVRLFGATVAASSSVLWWEMTLQDFYAKATALSPHQRSLANLIHTFYQCHAQKVKPTATRWGDKTPLNSRHLVEINRLFPEAKIVHVLRDGRDVVASIHELGWHTSLGVTCDAWLSNMKAVSDCPQRNHKGRFLEIRYERLVSDPEEILRQLCEFIGLDYRSDMFNFHQHPERLGHEAEQAHHKGLARPLNADSIGRWRNRLNTAEQQYVIERLGPTLAALGYDGV